MGVAEEGIIMDVIKTEVLGKTDKGKSMALYFDKRTSLYHISFAEGGELPQEFLGKFTTPEAAKIAVKMYNARIARERGIVDEKSHPQDFIPETPIEGTPQVIKTKGRGAILRNAVARPDDAGIINLNEPEDDSVVYEDVPTNFKE